MKSIFPVTVVDVVLGSTVLLSAAPVTAAEPNTAGAGRGSPLTSSMTQALPHPLKALRVNPNPVIVANPGQTAANSPFFVDLFIAGKRVDTVKHNPLPGRSQQRVISNLARPEVCTATQFRIALDTQQLVNERDEGNNTQQKTSTPPCPDLVVDIDKDSVSNGFKYRAKVQVTNRGNLSTKRQFTVILMGTSGGVSPTGWGALPVLKQKRMGSLAPNQTESFYEGGDHLGTTTFSYRALADRFNEIRESNENNNEKRETMGGGY